MSVTFESAFNTTLGQSLKSDGTDTIITLAAVPITVTSGVLRFGSGNNVEFMTFTGVSSLTVTGVTRGLDKNATSITDATAANKKAFAVGTPVKLVAHSLDLNFKANLDTDNAHTGGITTRTSTTELQWAAQSVTETERDALTGVINGGIVLNSTSGVLNQRIGAAWTNFATGTTVNGSETVAGKYELSTNAEQGTATSTGGSGARLVVPNDQLVKTSSGAGDENKPAILDSSGKFADGFQNIILVNATTLTDGSNADALHVHGAVAPNIDFVSFYGAATAVAGTGAIVDRGYAFRLNTGGTSAGSASKGFTLQAEGTDWDRNSDSEMNVKFEATTDQDAVFGMIANQNPLNYDSVGNTDEHVGFAIEDGILIATNANGTTQTKTTISGITLTNFNTYKIEWLNAVSAKFFVNGVLEATHTTNLPSGSTFDSGLRASIVNRVNSSKFLNITKSSFQQIIL